MNSTSFTCVNDSKICDLYRAIFCTNIFGNTAFERANKSLWRAIRLLKKANQPLRRANQSLRRSKQSLRRSKESLRRSKQSLRRSQQSLRRSKQSLRRSKQSLRRSNQSLTRSKQSLRSSEQLKPDEADGIHPLVSKSINLVHLKHVHSTDSSYNYRFSVRKLTKQPNSTRCRRDREPSRLPLKKIILAMRKRKNRTFLRHNMLKSAPKSSILNKIASSYKQCCFQFVHMQYIFIKSFGYFKPCINLVCRNITSERNCSCDQSIHIGVVNQYDISQNKLLLSGDIELNPGPVQNTNSVTRLPSNAVLEQRLRHYQLRPFDVGGDGDCFFRAVSHQLYGDPEHHFEVRTAGITYLRDNPERFIESNTENSWLVYLNNMSMPGTWADGIIIQAVADQLQLKLIIAETHEQFQEYSIVQPVLSTQQLTDIYLGHIDELHYVSTLPCSFLSGSSCDEVNSAQIVDTSGINITENISNRNDESIGANDIQRTIQILKECFNNVKHTSDSCQPSVYCPESKKEKRKKYVREYRKRIRASESFQPYTMSPESEEQKTKKYKRLQPSTQSPKSKEQNRKQYIKEYRKQKRASESFQASTQSPKSKEQNRKQYIKEYRKQKRASESFQPSTQSPESKEQNRKQYIKEYRKQKRASESFQPSTQSPESKEQKRKQYVKEYRKQKRASECFQPSTQIPESKEQ